MRDHQTNQKRTISLVLLLCPIPFLLGCLMIAAAFWQNDADYVFGRVKTVDAILIDAGSGRTSLIRQTTLLPKLSPIRWTNFKAGKCDGRR
jgi:hypothetical protein